MPTQQVSLRLPPDVLKWLRQRRKETLHSMADSVTLLIRAEIAKEAELKKPKGKTL